MKCTIMTLKITRVGTTVDLCKNVKKNKVNFHSEQFWNMTTV